MDSNVLSSIVRDRFFFIKSDYKLIKINFDDILYIEGLKDYVRIHLSDGKEIASLMNMKCLDELLPHPEFLRVHRSYILHMSKIPMVNRFCAVFGEKTIPFTGSYKKAVQDYLESHTVS